MNRTTLRTLFLTLAAAGLLVPTIASAGPRAQVQRRGKVDARQDRQDDRIDNGKRSGEITKREGRKLEHQQRGIQRAENRAKADGVVTRREARKIEQKQDKANRDIHRAKTNNQKAPRAR